MQPLLRSPLLAVWLALPCAQAQQAVEVPSAQAGVTLPGLWFKPVAAAPAAPARVPAVVLLHGCGGARDARGALSARLRETAEQLNALGAAALVIDSFSPRGERQICTQRLGTRSITQQQRRHDALGALQWLAARPDVDERRLGLIGWSNGGSTVLAATNTRHPDVAAATVVPAFAAAFYPGCEADLKRGYTPSAPLLMQVGAEDDWTPPGPCQALAAAATGVQPVQIDTYAGAGHGFDSRAPVRLRPEVPNGVHPGQGVHVGGHPAAREAALRRLQAFVRERLGLAVEP